MFYSQFILAKKGPLGTIWIAAHLERKLRKNQVADTDIGVSVDSILFPEVPIALRLSSHLLLGVVRIYSRKVNYLFHDCSEALLKIKQAFRSTAVDLPPEESTAPYHSITLPETFDLDDFELPDSAFFQGNYVDHHISTREQITLQDTMEGAVYSTSQFGLDERFGDGDGSQIGLDLDEDLFLDKAATPGHAVALLTSEEIVDPQACGQPMTPFTGMDIDEDENNEERTAEISEFMSADVSGEQNDSDARDQKMVDESTLCFDQIQTPCLNYGVFRCTQIEGQSANPLTDLVEHVHSPSTAGLVEKAVLANVQEDPMKIASLPCNHHSESEDHNSTNLVAKEKSGEIPIKLDHHIGHTNNVVDYSLLNDKRSGVDVLCMPSEEDDSHPGDLQSFHVKQQGNSPSTAESMYPIPSDIARSLSSPTSVLAEQPKPISPVSECSDRVVAAMDGHERAKTLQYGVISNNAPTLSFIDQTHVEEGVTTQTPPLDPAAASSACSREASMLDEAYRRPLSDNDNVSYKETSELQAFKNVGLIDVDESFSRSHALPSGADHSLGSVGRYELDEVEAEACVQPQVSKILNPDGPDGKPCRDVVRACSSHPNQPDVLSLTDGEGCYQVLEANQIVEPLQSEDIQANLSKSDVRLDNAISGHNQLETSKFLGSSDLPAPETLLSVPAVVTAIPNDLPVESTLDKEALADCEGSEDGVKMLSGKKRHSMESTPILQSGNSVELSGVLQSRTITDSVPDDNDLLSSILVGRRNSALKMRPTPPPPEVASSKRPRVAPRISVSKRKVLMDDIMVLHGDTIRQQLTSTEDIRRMRRKAPCTRPEIWMIQKQLLEDEIFCEPILTGMSVELIGLHNQTYDLTDPGVSQIDANNTSLEVLKGMEYSTMTDIFKETSLEGCSEAVVLRSDEEALAAETRVQTEDQHSTKDASMEGFTEAIIRNHGEAQPTKTHVEDEKQLSAEHAMGSLRYDNLEQTEGLPDITSLDSSKDGQLGEITTLEINKRNDGIADVVDHASNLGAELPLRTGPLSGDDCNISVGSVIMSSPMDRTIGPEAILQNDELCSSPNQNLVSQSVLEDAFIMDGTDGNKADAICVAEMNGRMIVAETVSTARDESTLMEAEGGGLSPNFPQECQVDNGENTSSAVAVSISDNHLLETTAEVLSDSHFMNVNPLFPSMSLDSGEKTGAVVVTTEQNIEGISMVVDENEVVAEKARDEEGMAVCSEEPQKDSSFPLEPSADMVDVLFTRGEYTGCEEANPKSSMDFEITALDNAASRDFDDFGNVMDGNDTEFLNVDDDEVDEEEDVSIPSTEDAQFFENSGWSSRTRAVAKYLQTLFGNEAGHGRKVVPVDNLLAGKTRKEASRMFFETLVLKTRDYIHVEQENPFDNINVKPRVKLMKSDF